MNKERSRDRKPDRSVSQKPDRPVSQKSVGKPINIIEFKRPDPIHQIDERREKSRLSTRISGMAKTSGWGGYASIPQLNPQFVPQVSVPRVPVPMDSENIDVSKQSERAPSVNIASKKRVIAPTRRVAKIDKIREMSPEKSVVSSESNSKYFGYLNQIKNNLHFSIFHFLNFTL